MKKLNNKILIIVLLALAGVFALSRIFRASSREGNLPQELISLDTASVTEIRVYPNAEKNKEIKLVREGKSWRVKMENNSGQVEQGSMSSALGYFTHLKPLRLVSKKKTKWEEFNVGDTSTRVKFMKGIEVLADIRIGKIGLDQQPGQQQFNPGGIFTHVRLSEEDQVYAVEGFLESSFNKRYNDWRDKTFLRLREDGVARVAFSYPADSGFVLEKKDKKWWLNDAEADSTKVKGYLLQLQHRNATTFADDVSSKGDAQVIIQFSGAEGTLATVQGWRRTDDWVMNSSHQPGIYFSSKGLEGVLERKKSFLMGRK
ncbi:MAG TPA: DUF4340 domain-containing protein [Cyclobacteriaceae bacterium]|nr:DUF4340 domain-containing protein [Cyclobacteriaceae bacterium]